MFYLDHNATTPMTELAIEIMADAQRQYTGNPSSLHSCGADARELLEVSRAGIAGLIGCQPEELFFTSGGTEANNLAIWGVLEKRPNWGVITSGIEHKSVLKSVDAEMWNRWVHTLTILPCGAIDLDNLSYVLREAAERPVGWNYLVSMMMANNETGVIQPIRVARDMVKKTRDNLLIHVDAVQAFGKIRVNVKELGVDLMTISAHKLGGPKGIGALYVREGVELEPLIRGGHQERDLRAGTENVAAVAAFSAAALSRYNRLDEYGEKVKADAKELTDSIMNSLDGVYQNGGEAEFRLANTVNLRFSGVDSDALVLLLSVDGIMVSNGSACESKALEGSHVLRSMGQTEAESKEAIRFSLSDDLPEGAVSIIAKSVVEAVDKLRGLEDLPF